MSVSTKDETGCLGSRKNARRKKIGLYVFFTVGFAIILCCHMELAVQAVEDPCFYPLIKFAQGGPIVPYRAPAHPQQPFLYSIDRKVLALEPLASSTPPDVTALSPGVRNLFEFSPKPYVHAEDANNAKNAESVFVVGGTNSNDTIQNMATLTGVPLDTLTERAMPTKGGGTAHFASEDWENGPFKGVRFPFIRRSHAGHLYPDQTLRSVLLKDNTTVLQKHHLTHQQVAEPLLLALKAYENAHASKKGSEQDELVATFSYGGRTYQVSGKNMGGSYTLLGKGPKPFQSGWVGMGTQGSIFNDDLFANWEATITDQQTGQTLSIDALTPHMIYRYGFYQGGPYRTAPTTIIEFFGLDRAAKSDTSVPTAP